MVNGLCIKGPNKVGADYDAIEWYTSTSEGHHFIGKQVDGWHEVHNDVASGSFESILSMPSVTGAGLWSTVSGDEVPSAYVNESGEFIFLTKSGENEALHIAGKVYDAARKVNGLWLFSQPEGKLRMLIRLNNVTVNNSCSLTV